MLHFLIGLAVLLWIIIQLTYFISAIRESRRQKRNYKRGMELLYPNRAATPAPPEPRPGREQSKAEWQYWRAPLGTPAHLLPPKPAPRYTPEPWVPRDDSRWMTYVTYTAAAIVVGFILFVASNPRSATAPPPPPIAHYVPSTPGG